MCNVQRLKGHRHVNFYFLISQKEPIQTYIVGPSLKLEKSNSKINVSA